jgi:hypothetical protein
MRHRTTAGEAEPEDVVPTTIRLPVHVHRALKAEAAYASLTLAEALITAAEHQAEAMHAARTKKGQPR